MAPAVRQQRPPKWPRDPHALRRPAPGLRPLASAAFGHGDRLGILRVQGALVIHVVLHNNNTGGTGTAVLQCTLQYFCSTGQYQRLVQARFERPGDLVTKKKCDINCDTCRSRTDPRRSRSYPPTLAHAVHDERLKRTPMGQYTFYSLNKLFITRF